MFVYDSIWLNGYPCPLFSKREKTYPALFCPLMWFVSRCDFCFERLEKEWRCNFHSAVAVRRLGRPQGHWACKASVVAMPGAGYQGQDLLLQKKLQKLWVLHKPRLYHFANSGDRNPWRSHRSQVVYQLPCRPKELSPSRAVPAPKSVTSMGGQQSAAKARNNDAVRCWQKSLAWWHWKGTTARILGVASCDINR